MRTHDGPHDGANPHPGCYGCELQAKNLTLSSAATPTRGRHQPFRPITQPSWEAGVAGEHRVDGAFMPYLDRNLEPIGVKEMADNRRQLEAARHRQLHDPDYGKG